MYQKRYLTVSVRCPGDPLKIETMQITQILLDTGWFPAPCGGCNSANGLMPCSDCCRSLTSMFFHNPDIDVSEPITPCLPNVPK